MDVNLTIFLSVLLVLCVLFQIMLAIVGFFMKDPIKKKKRTFLFCVLWLVKMFILFLIAFFELTGNGSKDLKILWLVLIVGSFPGIFAFSFIVIKFYPDWWLQKPMVND